MKDIKDKMIRSAIISVFVLVMVIIALFYYRSKDPMKVDTENKKLIEITIPEIEAVDYIDNSYDKVRVFMKFGSGSKGLELLERRTVDKKTGEKAEDVGKKPSENSIRLFEFTLTSLDSVKTVADSATNLEQYGFDEPICEIIMTLKNGDKKGLKVGKRLLTTTNAYYLKLDDDEKIYVLSQWDLNNFLMTDNNIINM
ncbi:MAG: DUF4340 domain-containing protein [Clostridiales bacterium]|nr:DUF4340 domain-containing protein [Clostridiales bacterium]